MKAIPTLILLVGGAAAARMLAAPALEAVPYVTAQGTALRLTAQAPLVFAPKPQVVETETAVFVDPTHGFQSVVGIGGAITDAAAETFAKMPPAKQDDLVCAYYDRESGIGYSLARTNIASCDFSSATYAYVKDGDTSLASFSVAHDETYRIPLIKRAFTAAGGEISLFASPWSPPGWMKDTGIAVHGGHLKPEYRQAWANHFVKFVRAYEAHGIPIWGVTAQNEPMANQTFESCEYTAEQERDFIRDYLGPTLAAAGLGQLRLMAWDHNRDLIYHRAEVILADPVAAKYVWGLAYHWYETWTGGEMVFDNVRRTHEAFPNVHLLFSEGCAEVFNAAQLGAWRIGERYAHAMVNDFNAGAEGWTDWNILLDEHGGPNHVGNFCFAPVHFNTSTGELTYTNAFYYLGHFSKFVRPGAKRIATASSRSTLEATGFKNRDGSVAVIVLNRTDAPINYLLWIDGRAAPAVSAPHSLTTVVLREAVGGKL